MIIKIGTETFSLRNLYKSSNSYSLRIDKDMLDTLIEKLSSVDSFTILDGDTSHVVSSYKIGSSTVWDDFVDCNILFEKSPVIITKTELDNLVEQITNIELALCEMYENTEV